MNAPDASRKTTTNQTVEHNSAFNAELGHAGITLIENRETLPKKGRMETLTVMSVARATPLEVIQNQEQKAERGTPEQLLDRSHTCRQHQRADVAN